MANDYFRAICNERHYKHVKYLSDEELSRLEIKGDDAPTSSLGLMLMFPLLFLYATFFTILEKCFGIDVYNTFGVYFIYGIITILIFCFGHFAYYRWDENRYNKAIKDAKNRLLQIKKDQQTIESNEYTILELVKQLENMGIEPDVEIPVSKDGYKDLGYLRKQNELIKKLRQHVVKNGKLPKA